MDVGDCLARIAESQIGTRGDMHSGRAALYGYLLATEAKLAAFAPEWAQTGFGEKAFRVSLLNPGRNDLSSHFRLLDARNPPELPVILRIHSWCAAFVDWCVMQLLMNSPHATSLALAHRPKTASAFGLLHWGENKHSKCVVVHGHDTAPVRGDIAVFNFSHTGIVVESGKGHFHSVEGNTTSSAGGNQGYLVERRLRSQHLLKGFVRLPPKHQLGDYNISSKISQTP
jgi:CHAP domain